MKQGLVFKEWAPDQPDMGAEALITAKNVIPSVNGYKPFHPLDSSMGTVGAGVFASFVSSGVNKTENNVYAWALGDFYVGSGSSFATRGSSSANTASDIGSFAQYENIVIFAGGNIPKKHFAGSVANFSTLASVGTAPSGCVVGIIGQFVMIGNIFDAVTANMARNTVQWSGIDNPTSWPTPNSATAIAQQAGSQDMNLLYGRVNGIHGGDQHGVILQDTAVTRVTYVGPPAVFQFDLVANDVGSVYTNRSVKAGPWTYFKSMAGFCRTDGVSIEKIGAGKVDDYFASTNVGSDIQVSYDYLNKNVMFAFASTTPSIATLNSMLIFNEDTSGWSYCDTSLRVLLKPGSGADDGVVTRTAMAFNTTNILGKFQATAGSAVFETSDAEFNPGGRTYIDGIKPNIESRGTAPAVTVRLGYRDDLGTTPSYTSVTSANSATGEANFRVDAKYTRAEITITGNFDKATGFVASVLPSSSR